MKHIIITGSTRGIGLGLAEAFLKQGCRLVVCGRLAESVDRTVEELASRHGKDVVSGQPCDVTKREQLDALWEAAQRDLGQVDIWINNAGLSHRSVPLSELDEGEIQAVVSANIAGLISGTQVALRGMTAQGFGQIYNLEGLGSIGPVIEGTSIYAASKAAVTRFTRTVVKEVAGSAVVVGTIQPGMVLTDLLLGDEEERRERFAQAGAFFHLLAEHVETVAPVLARKVLSNRKHGARITYKGPFGMLWRAGTAYVGKRDVLAEMASKRPGPS